MDNNALTTRLQTACTELGISPPQAERLVGQILAPEIERLQQENEQLRARIQRHEKVEQEIVMLLKAKGPTSIIHDLRNVLNELALLKAVAGED